MFCEKVPKTAHYQVTLSRNRKNDENCGFLRAHSGWGSAGNYCCTCFHHVWAHSPAPPLHTVFWRSFLGFLANLQKKFGGLVVCFCIEKVVISVLIFYRLLQGPDFRTFDLSEFSRRLACFSLRDAWLWPLYSSLPRATLTPGGSLLEWNKDWEDCHHGVRLERASRAFYLVKRCEKYLPYFVRVLTLLFCVDAFWKSCDFCSFYISRRYFWPRVPILAHRRVAKKREK